MTWGRMSSHVSLFYLFDCNFASTDKACLAMTSMLTQSLSSHKDTLRLRSEQIDQLNQQIQEFSAIQKQDLERLQQIKERVRTRGERQARIANLKRSIAEKKQQQSQQKSHSATPADEVDPSWLDDSSQEILSFSSSDNEPNTIQRQFLTTTLPSSTTLKSHLAAYHEHNALLRRQADELRSRSSELEGMYRKVVSLCTGVAEERVEESLPALVAAVESERGALGEREVGRVRDFLRRIDGTGGIVEV